MSTVFAALIVTALICVVSVTVTWCWAWYERQFAEWYHRKLGDAFADGWDAALYMMDEEEKP